MRRAYIKVTPSFFGGIVRPSGDKVFSVDSDVPEDAKFIDAHYDPMFGCFRVYFEHESFQDIPEGCEIPELDHPLITYHTNKSTTSRDK